MGGKKAINQPTAIINPKTGKLAVSKEETTSVSLRYCLETLANNVPVEWFKEGIDEKKEMVKELMNMKDGIFQTKKETFENVIKKF